MTDLLGRWISPTSSCGEMRWWRTRDGMPCPRNARGVGLFGRTRAGCRSAERAMRWVTPTEYVNDAERCILREPLNLFRQRSGALGMKST